MSYSAGSARPCAGMRGKLPEVIKLPPSVTVPFGSFEEALKQKENGDVAKRLEAAVKDIPTSHAEEQLVKCRDIVMEVPPPCTLYIGSFIKARTVLIISYGGCVQVA